MESSLLEKSLETAPPPDVATPRKRRQGRHGWFRCWVVRPAIWGLTGLAIIAFLLQLFLNSRRARDWSRQLIAERLTASLERPVTIDDISFEVFPLSIQFWGLTIGGQEPQDPPFLELPWLGADADLVSLGRRALRLQNLRLERPVLRLAAAPEGLLRREADPEARPLDLYIDHLEVDRATLVYDRQVRNLSVSAEELEAQLRGLGEMHFSGRAAGRQVALRLPGAPPQFLDVALEVELRRDLLEVHDMVISGERFSSRSQGHCRWSRDEENQCRLDTRAEAETVLLEELGYFKGLYGTAELDIETRWRPQVTGVRARVRSDALEIWNRQVTGVEGTLAADRHGLLFQIDEGTYGDGRLGGTIRFETEVPGMPISVDLDFADIVLTTIALDQGIPVEGLAARVDGQLLYRITDGRAAYGQGGGEFTVRPDPRQQGLPIAATVPISIAEGVVRSDPIQASSQTPEGGSHTGLGSGWFDIPRLEGTYRYEIATRDIGPLAALLPLPEPMRVQTPPWLPTGGQGDVDGNLYVRPDEAITDLRFQLQRASTPVLTAARASGSMRLTPWAVEDLRLELADQHAAVSVGGQVPFGQTSEPAVLSFHAEELPVDQVRPWLDFELPFTGSLSGRLDLILEETYSTGELRASVRPARLEPNRAPFLAGTPLDLESIPIDSIEGRMGWRSGSLEIEHLTFGSQSGELRGGGSYNWQTGDLDLRFAAPSLKMSRSPLANYRPRSDLAGELALTAEIGGSLEQPEVSVHGSLMSLAVGRRSFDTGDSVLDLAWKDGEIQASGRLLDVVALEGRGVLDQRRTDLVLNLASDDLAGLFGLLMETPPEAVDGEILGGLHWRRQGDEAARLQLSLDQLALSYRGRSLTNLEPVRVDLHSDGAEIRSLYLAAGDNGSEVFLAGSLGYESGSPLDLRLQSSLATDWLELFFPDFQIAGQVELLGTIGGTLERPYFDGQGELREGSLLLRDAFPHTLEEARAVVLFYPQRLVLDHLRADLAGGRVELAGETSVPWTDQDLVFQLSGLARDIQLRYPQGWAVEGDADFVWQSTDEGNNEATTSLVRGKSQLRRIEYLDDLSVSFTQIVRRFFDRQRLEVRGTAGVLPTIQLAVDIEAPRAVQVQNNVASLTGDAHLELRGSLDQPVLFGEVDIDPGSQISYHSTDYELRRGRLLFTDPYSIRPEVDLVAVTEVRDFDIYLGLSGPIERLEANFSSEPPLPSYEVLRMLTTGDEQELDFRSVRQLGQTGEEQSSSAATFLYGQAASVIGDRVGNLFGFDKFRIDPLTEGGDSISRARVTVGKRISKDLFITYSIDPTSTEESRLRVEWQLERDLALVLTQNGDGTYTADARWEKSF